MAAPPPRDPDSVYRVVRLVSQHPDGWEQAAAEAVSEAAKTIPDLRIARVTSRRANIGEGGVVSYELALELSYRIDRGRRIPDTGEVETVRRYLLVANQTVGDPALREALRERVAAGACEFHVLVPASPSKDVMRLAALSVDPMTGAMIADLPSMVAAAEDTHPTAAERLRAQMDELRSLGAHVTGEVGGSDPMSAIAAVLERGSFDEIVLSTLPAGASRWLKMDLPTRVERRYHLPVAVVTTPDTH